MLAQLDTGAALFVDGALWHSAKALLIVGAAIAAVRLLPRLTSSLRFLVVFYALLATLALPVLSAALPAWRVLPELSTTHAVAPPPAIASRHTIAPPGEATIAATALPERSVMAEASSPSLSFTGLVLGIWLAGVLLVAARAGKGAWHARRLTRQAVALDDDAWRTLLGQCADRLHLSRAPALRFHPEPIMPMTTGIGRPTVVLPVDAQDWSGARKREVLLHELAHVRRNDLLCEILSLAACALQWFNPVVWWAHRVLIIERERACDDMVIDAGEDPAHYADGLLETAVQFRATAAAAPGMARARELESRLLAVLDGTRTRNVAGLRGAAIMLGAVAALALPIASLEVGTAARAVDGADVTRLRAALESGDDARRAAARRDIEALGRDHPVVIELGEQLFASSDSDSRLFDDVATIDLAARGRPGIDDLLLALRSASAVDRAAAAQALGDFPDPRAVHALGDALSDRDWHVREWSARSLGDIGDPAAVDGLIVALGDPSAAVREWSARSLGDIGSTRSVDALIGALTDGSDDVREWSLRSLGVIGDRRAMDAIAGLLDDPDPEIREWSMRALADIQRAGR